MASVAQRTRLRLLNWRLWGGVAAAVVVLGGGGVYAYRRHVQAAAATSGPPQYITAVAGVGPVAVNITGSGSIAPLTSQAVDPQVSGTVGKVDVTVGQQVRAGQLLFQLIDTSGLADQVASAQASLAQAQEQLQTDEDPASQVNASTVQSDQLRLQQAQDTLTEAESNLAQAQATAAADAQVAAPLTGTVQALDVVAGQQVNTGQTVAVIQPSAPPTISVGVPEQDLPYLTAGTQVVISLPATAQTLGGAVTSISSTSSGTVSVNALGEVVSGGANTSTEAEYDVTVTPAQALRAPSGASATVTFTPHGTPPSSWDWSYVGDVAYEPDVNATAAQAGVVSGLSPVGTQVAANASVATVTPVSGTVTPAEQTVQQDQYQVQQDQISVQQDQISLSAAQNPTPPSAATLAAAQAAVSSDQQTLQQRQASLAELTVTSPMVGVVTAVGVQPAEVVGPNTSGVTLESAGAFQAEVSVAEGSIGQVAVGDPAAVTVAALPGQTFGGKVSAISPVASGGSGTSSYTVYIDVTKPQGLLSGMSATATITTQQVASTLRVSTAAVKTGATGQKTVSVLRNGKPVPTPVTTGLSSTQWTQILSGVQPGQSIVLGILPKGAGIGRAGATTTAAVGGGRGPGGLGGGGFAGGGFGGTITVQRGG